MSKRIVTILDATGNVLGEWRGGDEQTLAPVAKCTHRQLADGDTRSYSGMRWNGTRFTAIPPVPVRVLSAANFARRFTIAEETAIDALADTDRVVRVWMRRLWLSPVVHLDHPDVITGLAYLTSVGIPSIWADTETANHRIKAIRV